MNRVALVFGVLLLAGCPDTGIVCRAGTNRCGNGCDEAGKLPRSDPLAASTNTVVVP